MSFLSVVITQRNIFEVLYTGSMRATLSSNNDLSTEHDLIQRLGDSLPLIDAVSLDDGAKVCNFISIKNGVPSISYQVETLSITDGEVMGSERGDVVEVYCLDDLTQHPEKVQKVAAIVFTPEVKAAEQARLDAIEAERIAAAEKAEAEAEAKRIEAEKQAVENAAAAKVERIRKQEEFQAAVAAEVERQLAAKA
jgi:hypothetical protein